MGLFEQLPYANFHELNLAWVLEILKKLDVKVDNMNDVVVQTTIQWLQDNADSFAKYNVPVYNVTDYDILPGTGDIYVKMHDFLRDYPAVTGGIVYMPAGYYETSYTLFIPENTMLIGQGADTVLYWNEYNTWYGTGLATAGSNVKICNMRVEQKSQGIFPSGGQPGCIGISTCAKANVNLPAYDHNFIDGDVHDITIENIYSEDAMYVLQFEPGTAKMTNVTARNIFTPVGTVSVGGSQAGGEIHNLKYENIHCSFFRTHVYNGATASNCMFKNIECESMRCDIELGVDITYENINMQNGPRYNSVLDATKMCLLRGDATFINCTLIGDATSSTDGMGTLVGHRKWIGCHIESQDKVLSRVGGDMDTNWDSLFGCEIFGDVNGTASLLVGYGAGNHIDAKVYSYLIGDGNVSRTYGASASTAHPNRLVYKGDTLSWHVRSTITGGVMDVPASLFTLPLDQNVTFDLLLYGTNVKVPTSGKYGASTLDLAEYSINLANYAGYSLHEPIPLTRAMTPGELYYVMNN